MSRIMIQMGIDDALHIPEHRRAEIIASYPPHEVEARTKGIPVLGSGKIYPVTQESISVPAFPIPRHWPIIGGMDFGWDHPTSAVQTAWDRDADCVYVASCYKRKQATPLEHAATLKNWGPYPWAWPHDGHQQMKDGGKTFRDQYTEAGMTMLANHATHPDGGYGVEAGVSEILTRMQTGRFKVFAHLVDWFAEFNGYHRRDGKIFKERDDIMDATRMAVMSLRFAVDTALIEGRDYGDDGYGRSRNSTTGY